MDLWQYVSQRWDRLSLQALLHLSGVVQCTIIAAVIGVVVGVLVYRSSIGSAAATALASTVLTVPSFALLGLLIPFLGLGVAPSVTALVLYGLLPIVRNTIVGLNGVDPAVTDAAKGIGMGRLGVLTRVELRLAWPADPDRHPGLRPDADGHRGDRRLRQGPRAGLRGLLRADPRRHANSLNQALAGTLGVVILALVLDACFVLVARLTVPKGIRD